MIMNNIYMAIKFGNLQHNEEIGKEVLIGISGYCAFGIAKKVLARYG